MWWVESGPFTNKRPYKPSLCTSRDRIQINFLLKFISTIAMIVHMLSYILLLMKVVGWEQKYIANPYNNNLYGNSPLHHYKATINDIPYHVLIAFNRLYCSGALIKSKVVTTAASCFIKWRGQRIVIKIGSDTVTGPTGQVIEVVDVKRHEYFGHNSMLDNDIAILMLNEHVQFNPSVMKVVLAEFDTALAPGTTLEVSGWGFSGQQSVKYANSLLWSDMDVVSSEECAKAYPNLMTMSNFCAKYTVDRRLSDNGGPAVYKDKMVGILSYGASKSIEPYVALITNVSYFHRWLSLNVLRFLTKYCAETITEEVNYNLESSEDSS